MDQHVPAHVMAWLSSLLLANSYVEPLAGALLGLIIVTPGELYHLQYF
jgi:hypothetical protein